MPIDANGAEQEPVRRNLGGLLLDQTREIAFGMLGTQHGCGRRRQRGVGRGIDVEFSHIPTACKQGTRFASVHDVKNELLPAASGAGPLLQRDYWAVFAGCALKPSEIMTHVKTHFCELPPAVARAVRGAGRRERARGAGHPHRAGPAVPRARRPRRCAKPHARHARRDIPRQAVSRLAPTAIRLAM